MLGKTSTLQQMPFGDLANLPTCHQVHSQHDAAGLHKRSGICTSSLRSLLADAGAAGDEQSFHKPQQMMPQAAVGCAVQQRRHVGCVVKRACDVDACLGARVSSASSSSTQVQAEDAATMDGTNPRSMGKLTTVDTQGCI